MSVEAGKIASTPCFEALPQTTIYIDAHVLLPVIIYEQGLHDKLTPTSREFANIPEVLRNIVSNKLRCYYVH